MKLKSSEPFWIVKNGILNAYPSLRKDIKTDVLIVGGGITGSLIAHQCIKDGYRTVVADRREIAHGSTSASTAMLQYEIDTPLYQLIAQIGEKAAVASYKACFESIDILAQLAKEIGSDCGFKKKDSLYFAAYKKDVPWLKKEFDARKAHQFPVTWLEQEDVAAKFKLEHTYGGILSDQGASMDVFRMAHDLLAYNHKKGLEVYDKTDIEKVQHQKNGIVATTEYGNKIKAAKIIYCNGYESTEIIKEQFVDLLSTYAIVGEQCAGDQQHLENTLFWNTADPYLYMRTTEDNRLLIGGEDESFVNPEKRDHLLPYKAKRLAQKLERLLPGYDLRRDFMWAGTFGATKDGLPYIGKHPDFKNAYFVLGFGGNGITFSVIGMDMVSCFLQGKQHKLSPYFKFGR
ncbi:FAD-dependent oxidoreductase [Taibaiella sp. KBW10]|uniref:NAD(P)/FAD-dependent oxidoreductase n=1 Tax=Taibaiella sp. KBW10 TaxID=2153357 RepID=UPI000F5B2AF2|nr:FAD-dependent oxidoreductase [Taibaiella sp. KBW10]RQO30736.1 FAD-dependent oxidoreductase [Taibaiella sp. KBW10]